MIVNTNESAVTGPHCWLLHHVHGFGTVFCSLPHHLVQIIDPRLELVEQFEQSSCWRPVAHGSRVGPSSSWRPTVIHSFFLWQTP
jgi:hypothetical protein